LVTCAVAPFIEVGAANIGCVSGRVKERFLRPGNFCCSFNAKLKVAKTASSVCYDGRGMEGQLSEHPFAELLYEIFEKQFSGAVRVERERVKAVVYFEDGELVYATCNLRNLRLIEYFKKRNLSVDDVQSRASDFALAEGLLARGMISKNTLEEMVAEQVTDVLRVLLLFIDGKWSFDERARLTESLRGKVNLKQLMLDAARRMESQFVTTRFGNPKEPIAVVIQPDNGLNLSTTEGFLLSRIDGPMELGELIALSGQPEAEARRTIYGLILANALRRQSWPYALKPSHREKAMKARPTQTTTAPPLTRDPKEELSEFLERLAAAMDHYAVLDVSESANAAEIKIAYYALARRFHPDRFHDIAASAVHGQLESAFARITQAHELLSDTSARATYDSKLAALRRAGAQTNSAAGMSMNSTGPNGQGADAAEQQFKQGVAAMQMRDLNTATACLSAAARLAPNQPQYRAYYGRALASHPQTKRLAEAELQAAVKLAPADASYRLMLATLYSDLGFWRRAISELERALSIDPKNIEAKRMLQSLEAKK
jgi:tetratricopeptide (TPR) repeat protein